MTTTTKRRYIKWSNTEQREVAEELALARLTHPVPHLETLLRGPAQHRLPEDRRRPLVTLKAIEPLFNEVFAYLINGHGQPVPAPVTVPQPEPPPTLQRVTIPTTTTPTIGSSVAKKSDVAILVIGLLPRQNRKVAEKLNGSATVDVLFHPSCQRSQPDIPPRVHCVVYNAKFSRHGWQYAAFEAMRNRCGVVTVRGGIGAVVSGVKEAQQRILAGRHGNGPVNRR